MTLGRFESFFKAGKRGVVNVFNKFSDGSSFIGSIFVKCFKFYYLSKLILFLLVSLKEVNYSITVSFSSENKFEVEFLFLFGKLGLLIDDSFVPENKADEKDEVYEFSCY